MAADGASKFGSCCEELKDILEAKDFDPLFAEEDGVLFMSVGVTVSEDEAGDGGEGDMGHQLDSPVYFCPFCGTSLQTREEVDAKLGDFGPQQ